MSKTPLSACPTCARHVRVNEARCPFCEGPLPSSFPSAPARPTAVARLSRAALYALGVSALSASASAACGSTGGTGDRQGVGVAPPYGGFPPPVDAGDARDSSDEDDQFTAVAAYGGLFPPPMDAGLKDAPSGLDAADGAPPGDASAKDGAEADAPGEAAALTDAEGQDVIHVVPLYGLPPMP